MNTIPEASYQLAQYGTTVLAGCPGYGYFSQGGPGGYMWYAGGHIMMIAVLILLFVSVYLVARGVRGRHEAHAAAETPLDIIKRRYAKGEIGKEQYESLKADLKT